MRDVTRDYPHVHGKVERGQKIFARDHNMVVDALNRLSTGIDGAKQSANFSDTVSERIIARFRIEAIEGDYLEGIFWDGFTEPDFGEITPRIQVAKPFMLRTSLESHGDVTFTYTDNVTRTASADGEDDETQVIVPSYEIDDELIIMRGINGETGVISETDSVVEWIDMNIDARAWAKEAE